MYVTVLNMPLDYLSCFTMVLRGIHRKVDISQTDYSIHSKLRIFWSHTQKYTIKANERLKKWSTIKFDILVLSLIFFVPMSQTISVINRSGTYFFYTHQISGACAGRRRLMVFGLSIISTCAIMLLILLVMMH